jgi:hypothetical protein
MYVIQRTDQGGGYVAQSGSAHSYVKDSKDARKFSTKEEAESERCPQNERVVQEVL